MTQETFASQYLQQLNEQQRQAVLAVEGAVLLLAVPGSGKTRVLVTRLGYMILCRNIPPERILTMTYTKAATVEMAQRFSAMFGKYCQTPLKFSTINSLSNQIIRHYSQWKNSRWPYLLPDGSEILRLIQQVWQEIHGDFPTDSTLSEALRAIAYIKNQMLTPEEIEQADLGVEELPKLYRQYEKTMRSAGFMDFDDQMVFAHRILTQNPEVLAHFQNQYPYICIDESQDTSKIQHAIIRLLTRDNLFMVGDEDQSIYGFRAAYPEALLNFEQDHPGGRVLLMETNYRSTREIVEAANRFILRNKARRPKESQAVRGSGCPIRTIRGTDRSAQLQYILNMAADCPQDTAVLFRNNDSAIALMDLLDRHRIPFLFRGSDDRFFNHRVVADLTDMIRFAHDPQDADIFMRIYYKFGGGISKETALYACQQSRNTGRSIPVELAKAPDLTPRGQETARDWALMLPEIPKRTADFALLCLWNTLKYGLYAAERKLDGGKLEILRLLAANVETPTELLDQMGALRDMMHSPAAAPEGSLTISTIHSSKGLEYHSVILVDVFDGVLPSVTRLEAKDEASAQIYEEERRLCYVAMTRAKKELTLFQLQSHPSEFISEITASLPRPACAQEDVFASLYQDLRGRTYTHREYGKGIVIAQGDDALLVEFAENRRVRMTLAQMLEHRAVTYTREKLALPPEDPQKLTLEAVAPGTRVVHKTFGPGTVLTVTNGMAAIQFGQGHGRKTIMLKSSIEKGFLHG